MSHGYDSRVTGSRATWRILIPAIVIVSFAMCALPSPAQTSNGNGGEYAWVNGAHLWYQTKGKGDPVVIIPGGPGDSHIYLTPWFDELAKRYKVIYFDAFGRGKSDRAKDPSEYTFERDVKDLDGLRKALGIDRWSVIGHSYGGMVAQAYAIEFPNSVDKLVLSNTFYDAEMWQENNDNSNNEIRNQFPEIWDQLVKLRHDGFVSSSPECQRIYGQVPSGLLYFYDPSNASKVRSDSLSMNPSVYYQLVGADGDFLIEGDVGKLDFRNALKSLKMPVLIIAGRFDRVSVPAFSVKFRDYAPQAKFVMFEKSGHLPFIEETEKYFKTVSDFLKEGK